MKEKVPAIVLGCHKVGLGIIRSLGRMQVPIVGVYYNKQDMGYVSRYVSNRYQCPHPDQHEGEFIEFLKHLSLKWSGAVLIPGDDATLIPVSKRKTELSNYFKVLAPDWSITQKCIEKKFTYELAHRVGVPAPRTLVPRSWSEINGFVEQIGFPCLLKPSIGHRFYETFKQKMVFIENHRKLTEAYEQIKNDESEMMVQEFIPGDDKSGANYNSFFINGEPVAEVTAQKIRLTPRRIGFPCVVLSKRIPEVIEWGRKVVSALEYEGFSCIEFKRDTRDGVYKLMEVNGRLNLSLPLSVLVGVNFSYLTYRYLLSGQRPEISTGFKENLYWIDVEKDIVEGIKNYRHEKISVREFCKPYFMPHTFSIPSIKDPMPFMKRCWDGSIQGPAYLFNRSKFNS